MSNVFEYKLVKCRILKCICGVSDNVDYLHIYIPILAWFLLLFVDGFLFCSSESQPQYFGFRGMKKFEFLVILLFLVIMEHPAPDGFQILKFIRLCKELFILDVLNASS